MVNACELNPRGVFWVERGRGGGEREGAGGDSGAQKRSAINAAERSRGGMILVVWMDEGEPRQVRLQRLGDEVLRKSYSARARGSL